MHNNMSVYYFNVARCYVTVKMLYGDSKFKNRLAGKFIDMCDMLWKLASKTKYRLV